MAAFKKTELANAAKSRIPLTNPLGRTRKYARTEEAFTKLPPAEFEQEMIPEIPKERPISHNPIAPF